MPKIDHPSFDRLLRGLAGTPKAEVSTEIQLVKNRRATRKANKGRKKKPKDSLSF
jgi:hypothetical protein